MVANFTHEELNLIASALTKIAESNECTAKAFERRGYPELAAVERGANSNVERLKEKVQQIMIME